MKTCHYCKQPMTESIHDYRWNIDFCIECYHSFKDDKGHRLIRNNLIMHTPNRLIKWFMKLSRKNKMRLIIFVPIIILILINILK